MSEIKTAEQLYKETVLKKKEDTEEMRRHYRVVFSDASGRLVLNDILMRCRHFVPARSDEDVARQNVAKELLHVLGIFEEGTSQKVTNAYLNSRGETK
jgi:hypothetical protein